MAADDSEATRMPAGAADMPRRRRGAPYFLAAALALLLPGCATRPLPAPVAAAPASPAAETRPRVTILVSIDGFRADYLDRGETPNLTRLAAEGVRAAMRPSFPSKTFPNHYALVTGLRPDRSGMIDNVMEDPRRPGITFTIGDPRQALDPFWWDAAEPIWITAEHAGIRTGTMFWPGSEVAFGDTRPSDWQRYDMNITGAQRVRSVIDWLRRPAAIRPRFVTLYFDTVDTAGHRFGPDAPETNAAIRDVDARIGELVQGLADLHQSADLVIVADHGMAATSPDRVVPLESLVDPALVHVVTDGPYSGMDAQPGQDAAVAAALLRPHDHVQCWRKADIPARLHYGTNPRVPAFYCLAETGWLITRPDRQAYFGGTHGYDNASPEMLALFVASGPDFRAGATLPSFDNVDVYPLVARLIGVTPRPSDGTIAPFAPVLTGERPAH
jgi:predicted AlkP superfamily pyrophosphatase or phosphodiesterase